MKKSFLSVTIIAICLCNQLVGQGLCLKNISDFSFLNGGLNPRAVASADFNNDGKQDIVTANASSSSISILLGNGTTGFGTASNITTIAGNNPIWVTTADFNNDSKPDLAVSHFTNGFISILLGNGNGTFAAPINFTLGASLSKIVAADFNADGKIDIVGADYYSGAWIAFGNGNGTFATQTQLAPGNGAVSLEIGDINNDFHTDIITVNSNSSNNVAILTGVGDGTFNAVSNLTVGGQPKSVAIADLDNDGNKDLVFTANATNSIAVLINNGGGTFGLANSYACDYAPTYAIILDVNADGKKDVITANNASISVLLNSGSGVYGAATNFFSSSPQMLITNDFNNDGKSDLVTANYYTDNYNLFIGNGAGSFANKTSYYAGGYCQSTTCGDFNGDGKIDVVTSNPDGNINILLGAGAGVFGTVTSYTAGVQLSGIASGDIDGDNKLDVVVANNNQSIVSVLKGNGSGGFGPATNYTCNSSYNNAASIALADMNGDNKLDIVTLNYSNNGSVMLNNGSGGFGAPIIFFCNGSYNVNSLVVDEFNGDNKKDIAFTTSGGSTIQVLSGDGTGSFTLTTNYTVGSSPVGISTGDFNADGKKDIIVANSNSGNTISLLINNGTGFNSAVNFAVGSYLNSVVTGDFNGDGKLDAVVGGNTFYVLTGNGSGGFTNTYAYNIAMSQNFVFPTDLNSDGKLDVIAFETSGGEIAVLLNSASPTITSSASANPICNGDQITLNGAGANTYNWTNSVQDNVPFAPVNTTTYTVTGHDLSNCSNTSVITVTVFPVPTLSIAATSTLICNGSPEILTASGAVTYSWTNGVSNGVSFYPTSDNSYSVFGVDAHNCSNSNAIYIHVDVPSVNIQATASSVCLGSPVTLTGFGANTYTWSGGVTDGVAFTPSTSNSYVLTGTDGAGCNATSTVSIAVNPLPIVSAHASTNPVCTGSSTALTGSGASSYLWTGGVTDGQPFSPTGLNTYTVTGTDNNNCSNTSVITVTVSALPAVTFTTLGFTNPVCDNAGIQTLSGAAPAGGSYSGTGVVTNTSFFVPSAVSAGTYTLTYAYTDNNNCTNSATNTVQVIPCVAGIQNYNAASTEVYPNPSTGVLYIKTATQETITEVYNFIGQLVLKQNQGNGASTLNISEQPNGLYKVVVLDASTKTVIYQSNIVKQQ